MSNARELAQIPSTPSGRRNLIINGAMNVAQRGTETTGVTSSGYYSVDRFRFGRSTGTYTISQEDDGPEGFGHSYKILTTSAGSEAAGNYQIFEYRFEGQDLQQMQKGSSAARKVTLTFYVKSNVTGNYQVNLRDVNNSRQVGAAFSVDTSATWEKKTITFPADTTGSFDNDNGSSMIVEWWVGAGSNFQGGAIPTSWEASTNTDRAANVDVDLAETVNNYIQFTGVQLEVGSVATEFEHRSFGEELALCQRYYERHDASATGVRFGDGNANGSATLVAIFPMTTRKRAVPTFSYSNVTVRRGGSNTTISSASNSGQSGAALSISFTTATSISTGSGYHIRGSSSSSYLEFDAEL